MSGIEFRDGELVVERDPNDLDELALRFTSILEDLDVKHVYVSGYVAILTGRSRATEDIDVLLEPLDERMVSTLVERVREDGLWGPAMPLDSAMELLGNGDNVWVARDGEMVPHLEVKFVRDEFDRASLEHSVVARIAGRELPIGPLELQERFGRVNSNSGSRSWTSTKQMPNSNPSEALAAKRERNREHRIEAVKRWVAYIQEQPPESWGDQQNRLVNSQLESARQTGLDADHYRRLEDATRDE